MLFTFKTISCYRKNGKLVIEISEVEILRDCMTVSLPGEIAVKVRNQDAFLHELTIEVGHVEADTDGPFQSELRQLIRRAAYRVAENGIAASYAGF